MNSYYKNAFGSDLFLTGRGKTSVYSGEKAVTLFGTSGSETLRSFYGDGTYFGGLGNDYYMTEGQNNRIVEHAGEGIDTIRSKYHMVLPDNVENLELAGSRAWYGGGNDLDNIIIGDANNQQMDGGKGNDVLIGGGGSDIFIIGKGNGSDVIVDFQNGIDLIRMNGFGHTSASVVLNGAKQVGQDVQLALGDGETLTLRSTQLSDLDASDFQVDLDTSQFTLTFHDEFDSLSLQNNGGTWRTEYGYGGPGTIASRTLHTQSQIFMDSDYAGTGDKALGIDPFSINNGVLTITAAPTPEDALAVLGGKEYTSGLLTSKFTFTQQYGYFELSAALPSGQGFWPAFWMLPADNSWPPELDIFEMLGKDPNTVYLTVHELEGGKRVQSQNKVYVDTAKMHVYGVDWAPDYITYFIDGTEVAQTATPDSMHKEMFTLINLQVGGSWAGPPDETTGIGEMKIDYFRAYRTDDTVSTTIDGVHQVYEPQSTQSEQAQTTTSTEQTAQGSASDQGTSSDQQAAKDAASVQQAVQDTASVQPRVVVNRIDGTSGGDRLIGSRGDDVIYAADGNDYINGASGRNEMHGGDGNDTYIVRSGQDLVFEAEGEGTDIIMSTVSYTLGDNVETLRLQGQLNIDGTGNDVANRMVGNKGDNVLRGLDGNDFLHGGTAGHDTLVGGNGHDIYSVNHAGITIVEYAGGGNDTVMSTVDYSLDSNVEILRLQGKGDIDGTGNSLANKIFGNSGDNIITGLGGADYIDGGAGNDVLKGGADADQFAFSRGDGQDRITDFNYFEDRIKLDGIAAWHVNIDQVGYDTVISYGTSDSITLAGVNASHVVIGETLFI